MKPGFVYLLYSEKTGLYKIGFSVDPIRRLKEVEADVRNRLSLDGVRRGRDDLARHPRPREDHHHDGALRPPLRPGEERGDGPLQGGFRGVLMMVEGVVAAVR